MDLPVSLQPDPSGKCYTSCDRKHDRAGMIRCQSCMLMAHNTCVGEKRDYNGTWICHFCRLSSQRIAQMFSAFNTFKNDITLKFDDLEQKYKDVNTELQALRVTNTDLVQQVQKLQNENQQLKSSKNNPTCTSKTLVIGDSIIRDFEPQDQTTLHVKSVSGANISMIKTTLETLHSEGNKYDKIFLVVGSKDCATSQKNVQSITNSAKDLFDQAKKLSNNIYFSSVLPRTDDANAKMKAESANLSIKTICNQNNVKFIDNDGSFLTADRTPIDALLLDGLHLNDRGTRKLITNLGIQAAQRKRQSFRQLNPTFNGTPARAANVPPLIPSRWNQSNIGPNQFKSPVQMNPQHHSTWNPHQNIAMNYYSGQPLPPVNQWTAPTAGPWIPQPPQYFNQVRQYQQPPDYNPARYCTTCRQQGHSHQTCLLGKPALNTFYTNVNSTGYSQDYCSV